MTQHFRLTLSLSADDLLIVTAYIEHAFDKAIPRQVPIPRPLIKRLREIAEADPTDAAFEHLIKGGTMDWDIENIGVDTVCIRSRPDGASLAKTVDVLGRLAPSCLTASILYEPVSVSQDPQGFALH